MNTLQQTDGLWIKAILWGFLLSIVLFTDLAIAGTDIWTSQDPEGRPIQALAVDPNSPETAYAGLDNGIVLKSVDGGASWFPTGNLTDKIQAIAVDYHTAGYIYAGTPKGIYRSANKGISWTASNAGLTNLKITALVDDLNTLGYIYAGTELGGVFKSVDAGVSWAATSGLAGTTINALAIDPFLTGNVYAATPSGIFKSVDSGDTWVASSTGLLPAEVNVSALVVSPHVPDTLFAASLTRIYRSIDGGLNWVRLNLALPDAVTDLAVDPNAVMPTTLYAATANSGIYKSDNNGRNWYAFTTGLVGNAKGLQTSRFAVDASMPPVLYAGTRTGVFDYRYTLATKAAFRATPATGAAPLTVVFRNTSTGYISSYAWDFGDLGSSPLANPKHLFASPGVYTVTLTVSGPGGSSSTLRNIQVTEAPPTVTIKGRDRVASEAGVDYGKFIVSRTGSTASALVVSYSIRGTATNGVDYRTLSGTVVIPIGKLSAAVVVRPIDDTLVEASETVVVAIAANAAYVLGLSTTARVVIQDND